MSNACPKCKEKLWSEVLCGIRVYRTIRGRKVYNCYCPKCGHTCQVKGDKA